MKVMVVGSGGREHALAWKLAQSPKVERVYVSPGNGGTALEAKCINAPASLGDPCSAGGQEAHVVYAKREGIDLTVIGGEAPLAAGIADRFRAAALAVIGPDTRAAHLESSKAYAKDFMERYGVRAAKSRTLTTYEEARAYAQKHFADGRNPLVVKADGLAAGKGVVVAADFAEADAALRSFMTSLSLGDAGRTVVLEDFLKGVEVSVLAAVSVRPGYSTKASIVPFVSARDHKRRFDGAMGPNTGGMGAIAPVGDFTAKKEADFRSAILEPTLRGLVAEGFDYRGFIFFGLMIDGGRCSLLEYNVRLGDPETQAVLPLLDSDLADLCMAIHAGSLGSFPIAWKGGACCAPVAVADGYPGTYRKGDVIKIDTEAVSRAGAKVFFAGTSQDTHAIKGDLLRATGGRVLAVSAVAEDADEARRRAYAGMAAVHFSGMGFRKDIGIEVAGKA
jgi:phosphoribosylamine--glycine ligase